ncbi:MAG: hypothetical protein ABF308_10555, partial [Phaeobacter gallaeciensis]
MSKFDFQFQKNASNQSVTAGLAMFETQKKAGFQQGSQAGTVKTARKYIDDAMDLVVSLDYNAARAMLDEALSIYPEDIVLLRLSGDVYLQQDDKDNALLTYM